MPMKPRILCALTGASCLATFPALAQSAAPAPSDAPAAPEAAVQNEIVVTATRRSESLRHVPMSVNVTTGDQLQKLNLFDAKDIQQVTPGLELTNTSGRNNATSLRGISFDPDQGTGPAVQVYLNEIPTDAQTVYTALYDVAQIEVLRGPQGTLRGLSSPAGAITIRTRRPDFDAVSGSVQATATSRAGYNVQGGISLPFSETFAIRAAALVDGNRLNQVYNVSRKERSRSRTESARLTLGWKPNADLTAYLTYQYLESDNSQYGQVVGAGNAPAALFGDPTRSGPAATVGDYLSVTEGPARFQNHTHIINLAADWNLGPATLSFVGAHQFSKLQFDRDQDVANAVPGYNNLQNGSVPYKVDTAELRLSSNNAGIWNWGLGAFYSKQTGTTVSAQRSDSFFAPAPLAMGLYLPINSVATVPVNSETLSFNATSRLSLGQFRLEGGLRYSILRKIQTATIDVTSPGFAGFAPFGIPAIPSFTLQQPGIPAALQKTVDRPLTGGASLSWEPTDTLTLYVAYAHSFRSGSAAVAVPLGISNDLILTHPEKTDSVEVGVKAAVLDHRLNLSLAGYYQKYDGFLSRFDGISYNCRDFFGSCNNAGPPINNATDNPAVNGAFPFNYNGNATVKGIEGTIDGRPTRFWDFSLSASYTHGRYDNALLPCNDYNGDGVPDGNGAPRITGSGNVSYCRSNGRLADIPDFSLSANSELRFPVGELTPFVRGLVNYRPGFFAERSSYDFESRTLLNAYIGIRGKDKRWELTVFAKNLLNQQRITNISLGNAIQSTSFGPYDSGYRTINAMNPREFGLSLSFNW